MRIENIRQAYSLQTTIKAYEAALASCIDGNMATVTFLKLGGAPGAQLQLRLDGEVTWMRDYIKECIDRLYYKLKGLGVDF